MNRLALALGILLQMSFLFGQSQQITQPEKVPGELLVRFKAGAEKPSLTADLNRAFPGIEARWGQVVSVPMGIDRLVFNPAVSHEQVLWFVKKHQAVDVAQSNHIIRNRATTPNDPLYPLQWQYDNSGANNGVVDADIDADLAWDITTGGLTPFGDTIVACVIDDGLDLNHPDFGTNRWYNHQEVANNQLDDDGNGYVDDFEGWNAYNGTDDVSGGGHGTPVTGIVGAKGNNGTGVSGVNWNVKLMIVKGGGNEAEAISAYSYPLVMRKLWNQTQGAKGAYVVVTNASWGVDFGQPSQAPLWCAIYDSLGKYGVLSAAATANLNIDVDVQGDLPTACPSEFLIAVTNTNNRDEKVTSAGYGLQSIDLGAPGANAYTVAAGGGYAAFGGTSGASPHVAGAVALAYSSPCNNLSALALTNPDSAAKLVKNAILAGVDSISTLQGVSTSGGRLNLFNMLQQIDSAGCYFQGCYQPFGLSVSVLTDSTVFLHWSSIQNPDSFHVRFREVGDTLWTQYGSMVDSLMVQGLEACRAYEFQVASFCDSLPSPFSVTYVFTSDGCCLSPQNPMVSVQSPGSVEVAFAPVTAAISYNLRYAVAPAASWTEIFGVNSPYVISGLDSCTQYELQVQTACDTGVAPYSASVLFQTTGCEACSRPYCSLSGGNAAEEWIAQVEIGQINQVSGSNGGYFDFSDSTGTSLAQTGVYSFSLTPGFSSTPYSERFMIYIDFNQDGDFADLGEDAYVAPAAVQTTLQDNLTIPAGVPLGSTRMRVVMRYNNTVPGCGSPFDFGEVEDYCVEILDQSMALEREYALQPTVFPNPACQEAVFFIPGLGECDGTLYIVGVLGHKTQIAGSIRAGEMRIDLSDYPSGLYQLQYVCGESVWNAKLMIMK